MKKVDKDKEYWRKKLTPKQYKILVEKGTEIPFTGEFVHNNDKGVYKCAACGNKLFSSDNKFDSGTGWPSFYKVVKKGNVKLIDDKSSSMHRVEVVCSKCGSHLGHVFDDGPKDMGGKRYCINSACLNFKKDKK